MSGLQNDNLDYISQKTIMIFFFFILFQSKNQVDMKNIVKCSKTFWGISLLKKHRVSLLFLMELCELWSHQKKMRATPDLLTLTAIWVFLSQIPIAISALVAKFSFDKILAFALLIIQISNYSRRYISSSTDITGLNKKSCKNQYSTI